MNKTIKVSKSIIAIFIGCFLALIIMEISLRALGYYQNHWTKFSITNTKQPDELRILALGESMTNSGVNPYPGQLQEILSSNPKINKKVKVINGGVGGSSSKDIVKNIDSYLDKFNPDIVVIMTGINGDQKVDYDQWANIYKEDKLNSIKTIKLIKYLYQNYKNKLISSINSLDIPYVYAEESNVDEILKYITNNDMPSFEASSIDPLLNEENSKQTPFEENLLKKLEISTTKDIEYVELANYYSGRSQNKKAIALLLKAISFNSDSSDAYQRLSDIQTLPKEYRVRLAQKAIETNPKNPYAYRALAEIYRFHGDTEKYIETYKRGIGVIPNSFLLLYEFGKINYSIGNLDDAEKYLLEALKESNGDSSNEPDIYQILAKIYQKQNRTEEASKVLGLVIESSDVLENNYPIIANILKNRGVKLIAMQYPLRNVNILKTILNGYDVDFVDNNESFRVAVERYGKENIFVDLFAGDFGHCTAVGNRIMADNVASVIQNKYVLNK